MKITRSLLRTAVYSFILALLLCCFCAASAFAEPAPEGFPAIREGIDFDGKDVYFYNWWSRDYWDDYDEEEATDSEKAQHAYRLWLQETYNVRLHEVARGDWNSCADNLMDFAFKGGESDKLALFVIEPGRVNQVLTSGAAAPIHYDMSADKWHHANIDLATINNEIYGTYVGNSEPRQVIFFNKRLLTEAGIDWNDIYDAQQDGTWTWDAFESYLSLVKTSGVAAAITGSQDDLHQIAVFSGGGSFIDTNAEGQLVPTVNSDVSKAALIWARRIWNTYSLAKPENSNWDWYKAAWENAEAAFYVGQTYEGFSNYGFNLADDWGCVAFPKKQAADSYVTLSRDNMIMVPSCYDDATVSKLIFIYDMWTQSISGWSEDENWADSFAGLTDERAIQETYGMLRNPDHQVVSKADLAGGINNFLWSIGPDSNIELLTEQFAEAWADSCDRVTADMNNRSFRVFFPDNIWPGEDVPVIFRPEEGYVSYNLAVFTGQSCAFFDDDVPPGKYLIPAAVFSDGGCFSIQCGASDGQVGDYGWTEKYYYDIAPDVGLTPLTADLTSLAAREGSSLSFTLSAANPSRILVQQKYSYADMNFPGVEGFEWVFTEDLPGDASSFNDFSILRNTPCTFRFSALVNGQWTAWSNETVLLNPSTVSISPRMTLPAGARLDFTFTIADNAADLYANILREDKGVLSPVASVKAWDAATGTAVEYFAEGVISEAGSYYLTLGPDPDYNGVNPSAVSVESFQVLSEALETPTLSEFNYTAAGNDITGTLSFPSGTEYAYVSVGRVVNGRFIEEYWSEDGRFSLLGILTGEPGEYQVRATALTHSFFEKPSASVADSATMIKSFNLDASNIPACPAVVPDQSAITYDGETHDIYYTIAGAEAVTCRYSLVNPLTDEEIESTPVPVSYTPGDRDYFCVRDPGNYVFTFWAKINGVWSAESEPVIFTVNPLGTLGEPEIYWEGNPISETSQYSILNQLSFLLSCENAEKYLVHVSRIMDGQEDEYLWGDYVQADDRCTATVALDELAGITTGLYRVGVTPMKTGWLDSGEKVITVTVGGPGARSGECGSSLSWLFDDGILFIKGSGPMYNYDYSSRAPWDSLNVGTVFIQDGVTTIGDWTFWDQTALTEMDFPETISTIGNFAFADCSLSGTLTLPPALTSIGDDAFYNNPNLTGVVLPGTLASIGNEAFCSCGLTSVEVPQNVNVTQHVFYYDDWSTDVYCDYVICLDLPSGLENVEDSAFAYCLSLPRTLPDFILPGELRAVEADAFSGTAPRFVWIPSPKDGGSVTIAAGAFAPCRNLKYVRLPGDCEIADPGVFPEGTIIFGVSGSPANDYADKYDYLFVPLTSVGGNG